MSMVTITKSTDQTKHTVSLIRNLNNMDGNLKELIERFKSLQKILEDLEETLMISKKLADKLSELYTLLVITEKALMALSCVPYVGPVAKVAKQVVTQIKNVVKQAKTRVNDLEKKIKPHRKKISKFKEDIDKIVNKLSKVDDFVKKDNQLVSTAHIMSSALPTSRYKNVSQKRLNYASKLQNKILIVPDEILEQINKLLSATDSIIEVIEKLCDIINLVFKPIIDVIDELDRLLVVVNQINKVMDKKINVVFKRISVKDILELLDNPLLAGPKKIVENLLEPLLKELGLSMDNIPGLGESVGSLGKVFENLNKMDKLKTTMMESVSLFTGDQNPQKTFKQVDVGKI